MALSFNRRWQKRFLIFLISVNISIGILGIYTLTTSPTLSLGSNSRFSVTEPAIKITKIEDIELNSTFFNRLPEFVTSEEESEWWQMQNRVHNVFMGRESVSVEFIEKEGVIRNVGARVDSMPFLEVVKITGLIYLVAMIYIISAVSVFKRQRSGAGIILAFFLLFGSLYFICSAPVVNRSITLIPRYHKILINFIYISAGGLITFVHFAFVFPRKKRILKRFPWIFYIFYGYFLITVFLYLSGIIGFGATFPFLCIWTLIMIAAFIHSFINEKDPFLKKQIFLSLLAPLIVGGIFIFLYIFPGVLGMTSMRLTTLALVSLILPFALPSAMDNSRLYQERLELEKNSRREREQIRQDFHDNILNELANISLFSEVSMNFLDKDISIVRERLKSIKDIARDSSRELRGFLRITDDGYNTWEDFCGHLRRYGYVLLKHLEIDFNLDLPDTVKKLKLPSLSVRTCIYHVFKEALINIIRHSHADTVNASLSAGRDAIIFEIHDNGTGFDKEKTGEGHYGLRNMKSRVNEIGGDITIKTGHAHGTHIKVHLPWK